MEQRSNRWCSAEQQWRSSGAIHSFQNAPLGPRGNRNAFSHFGTREACLTGITSFKLIPFSSECDNLWKCVQQSRSSRYYLNIQEHLMKQQNVFVIVFLSIGLLVEQSDIGPILQCIDSLKLVESSSTISIEKRQGLKGGLLCSSLSLLKNIRRDLGSLLLQPNLVKYIFVLYHNLENTTPVIIDDDVGTAANGPCHRCSSTHRFGLSSIRKGENEASFLCSFFLNGEKGSQDQSYSTEKNFVSLYCMQAIGKT